ncbi:hypothetical protein UP10_40620 [Bradyrhizobium sp. LTSPM299]|nr:hypothetical protein UP10_40620 [Bradyrhizobium sp. LTSPM299]
MVEIGVIVVLRVTITIGLKGSWVDEIVPAINRVDELMNDQIHRCLIMETTISTNKLQRIRGQLAKGNANDVREIDPS